MVRPVLDLGGIADVVEEPGFEAAGSDRRHRQARCASVGRSTVACGGPTSWHSSRPPARGATAESTGRIQGGGTRCRAIADRTPRTSARSDPRRSVRRPRPGPGATRARAASVLDQRHDRRRHRVGIAGRMQEAGLAVADHLGQATHSRGDHREATGHRFERGQAEAFLGRRQEEDICRREQRLHVLDLAHDLEVLGQTGVSRQRLGPRALGAVADDHQPRAYPPPDQGKDVDHRVESLDRSQVGDVEQQRVVDDPADSSARARPDPAPAPSVRSRGSSG